MADPTGTIGPQAGQRVSFEGDSNVHDSRVFIGAPDYRVFIWGIEVSADVFGMQITLQIDDQLNTAQVHLTNDNSKWIMPTLTSIIGYDTIPDELSDITASGDLTSQLTGTNTQGLSTPKGPITNPTKFAQQKR